MLGGFIAGIVGVLVAFLSDYLARKRDAINRRNYFRDEIIDLVARIEVEVAGNFWMATHAEVDLRCKKIESFIPRSKRCRFKTARTDYCDEKKYKEYEKGIAGQLLEHIPRTHDYTKAFKERILHDLEEMIDCAK